MIITLTGLAALASHLLVGATINVPITAALSGSTGLGALIGSGYAQRIPQAALGRGFAVVVCGLAVFLLLDTLLLNGPPHG